MHGWSRPEVRPDGAAGRLGSLPVAFGAEFDIQGAQVLPPEIVQWREFVLAARIVEPPDGQFVALSVDQPRRVRGVAGLSWPPRGSTWRRGIGHGRRMSGSQDRWLLL